MFVFVVAAGCSDDDSTPSDAGTDSGPGSGGGESGEGGGGGSGGKSGSGGTGGSSATGGGTGGSGSGGSGATDGGADDGGTGGRCGDVTCDPLATCDESGDEPTCECPFGYDDVSGFGTKCELHDPPLCMDDGDCDSDHCVDGVCCESACDEPPACHTDDGATCEDGETCVYPELDDGTACDDDDLCTDDDECNDGECEGAQADCDDDNICTADSCDSDAVDVDERCVNDGTNIFTADCAPDTLCEMDFACKGNARGDCEPNPLTVVDCTGTDDQCNVGECNPLTGGCVAVPLPNGTACDDENACNDGETCQAGNCMGGSARNCDDGNPCTDNSCSTSLGCQNPNNTAVCTDTDPCTENEHCLDGTCSDVDLKDCSTSDDQCNDGVCDPSNGNCIKQPISVSMPCNDSDNCTSEEACNAGNCVDPDDDSACGTGSSSCDSAPADPRMCTCDTVGGYIWDMTSRTCKADVCDPSPCNANATCNESGGNPFCTCDAGYYDSNASTDPVSGVTCSNIDECTGNPCGSGLGSCVENAPGSGYSCNCTTSGFTDVDTTDDGVNNPTCACDLGGTYALQIEMTVHWANVDGVADGTRTTSSWALRTHTYNSDGTLEVVTTPCGGTTPDLCGDGSSGIAAAAYAQFLTNQLWQAVGTPDETLGPTVPTTLPRMGAAFEQAQTGVLFGMHLTDPMGAWPARNELVGTQMTPGNNGSYWTNPDGGPLGVTIYAVPPGGIGIDGNVPDPPFAYPATSSTCGGLAYDWWPGIEGFATLVEVKRFEAASRIISGLKGNFSATSCGRIYGDVVGPDPDSPSDSGTNGELHADGRFYGCTRVNGGGETACATTACSTSNCTNSPINCRGVDFFDCQDPVQVVDDASFVIKKTTDTTCAQVRAHNASWWTTDP